MWVALLNLENLYGSSESLKKVFERALQFCEPMPVYQQLADIYAKSEKIKVRPSRHQPPSACTCVSCDPPHRCPPPPPHTHTPQEAENLYKTMVKRFRQNKAVWLSYGTFLLQQGQSDAAAALLQRALKSLPSKESEWLGLLGGTTWLHVSPPPSHVTCLLCPLSQVWT